MKLKNVFFVLFAALLISSCSFYNGPNDEIIYKGYTHNYWMFNTKEDLQAHLTDVFVKDTDIIIPKYNQNFEEEFSKKSLVKNYDPSNPSQFTDFSTLPYSFYARGTEIQVVDYSSNLGMGYQYVKYHYAKAIEILYYDRENDDLYYFTYR